MIRLKVSSYGMEDIFRLVDVMSHPDLRPLAEAIVPIMEADNRDGLLAGLDAFGDRMTKLEPNSWRKRKGDGPPLIPLNDGSPAISDYRVRIEEGSDRTLLFGEWPNTPWIHFHNSGFTVHDADGHPIPVVPRDPVGIRPDGMAKIAVAVEAFAQTLFTRF